MKVSVIIPVYNAEKYVSKAVKSAIDQKQTGEVILIEDHSKDDSLKKCKELEKKYKKVKLLQHPNKKNNGAGASRNLGIKNAKYSYISFLDADDYYLPNRFKVAEKIFKQENIDGVYDAVGTYFENKEAKKLWYKNKNFTLTCPKKGIPPEKLLLRLLDGKSEQFHTNGIVVKKEIFKKTGLFDPELKLAQDSAMWFRMAACGKLKGGSTKEPVAIRRMHSKNRWSESKNKLNKYESLMFKKLYLWSKGRLPYNIQSLIFFRYLFKKLQVRHSNLLKNISHLSHIIFDALTHPFKIAVGLFFILKSKFELNNKK